jgi:hypothetical protein
MMPPPRIHNFDDLKDGLFFEAVIQNYVGDFLFMQKIMTGFKNPCFNDNDKVYNLKKMLKGL